MLYSQASKEFLKKLRNVCGIKKRPLHEPFFFGDEIKCISNCINSTFVSTKSEIIQKFESRVKKYTKARYVVATVNGTSALHMALLSLNLKTNEEVIIPSFNFVAAANAISYCGAFPNFVDIDEKTLSVDPNKLENYLKNNFKFKNKKCFNLKTKRFIKGIIVPHTFGHPAKIDVIKKITKKFKLFLIEDAAESFGSFYKNKHTGTFGDIGIISFNGNKIITTGGGGVVITNKRKIYKKISNLIELSKKKHKWKFDYYGIGYNLKMPGINASLGLAQIDHIEKIIKLKRRIFLKYKKEFENSEFFEIIYEPKYSRSNYWLQNIKLKKNSIKLKNHLLNCSNENGLNTRPAWTLLHKLKHFKNCSKSNLRISNDLFNRIISLPSSANLI